MPQGIGTAVLAQEFVSRNLQDRGVSKTVADEVATQLEFNVTEKDTSIIVDGKPIALSDAPAMRGVYRSLVVKSAEVLATQSGYDPVAEGKRLAAAQKPAGDPFASGAHRP